MNLFYQQQNLQVKYEESRFDILKNIFATFIFIKKHKD